MDQISTFPARIVARAAGELPAGLADDAFTFAAEISSDRLDSYFTHMAESTLRNFAADARAGVSFQDSHATRRLGFGQSYNGRFEANGEVSRVVADFYTVPGIHFGGQHSYASTDDFIRAVKASLARDVSVGFFGGDMICDICGNSFYDWRECIHWPGVEYAVGDKGEQTVIATFTIEDARLSEVSAVYDGATPGAMILRAQQQQQAGLLAPETIRLLEVKYRIKLPGEQHNWPGVEIIKRGKEMSETNEQEATLERTLEEQIQELEARAEKLEARAAELEAEIARLRPLADDGNAYRADLVEAALTEGVRALGAGFPAETYRGMLDAAPLETIKQIRDTFAGQVNLPSGRQTVDDDERQQSEQTASLPVYVTPDVAYTG